MQSAEKHIQSRLNQATINLPSSGSKMKMVEGKNSYRANFDDSLPTGFSSDFYRKTSIASNSMFNRNVSELKHSDKTKSTYNDSDDSSLTGRPAQLHKNNAVCHPEYVRSWNLRGIQERKTRSPGIEKPSVLDESNSTLSLPVVDLGSHINSRFVRSQSKRCQRLTKKTLPPRVVPARRLKPTPFLLHQAQQRAQEYRRLRGMVPSLQHMSTVSKVHFYIINIYVNLDQSILTYNRYTQREFKLKFSFF